MQNTETVEKENSVGSGVQKKSARLVLGEDRGWLVNITLDQVLAFPLGVLKHSSSVG